LNATSRAVQAENSRDAIFERIAGSVGFLLGGWGTTTRYLEDSAQILGIPLPEKPLSRFLDRTPSGRRHSFSSPPKIWSANSSARIFSRKIEFWALIH
jgi:hypothetical protein